MNEKEMYLQSWEREFKTTMKVLKAFPANKMDFKPHEISRSAGDLAWTFVQEEKMVGNAIDDKLMLGNFSPAPKTFPEILTVYESSHKEMVDRIKKLSESEYNKSVKFPSGPKQMGDFRIADIAWNMLMDMVHHRGQFSVYLRMAGGKVPSIYGPSHDEPWR